MTQREAPKLDTRRAADFRAELTTRARAWIRNWSLDETPGDFGVALLDVAARFSSQVAEKLDRAGEKLSLGLLDWLAVRGRAARPARMPVAFKLADTAREPVFAPRPVRLQADVDGANVVFETETDVNLVPGTLAQIVGVDAGAADAWFLPPPGLSSLEPLEPLPDRWTLKNFATQFSTKLQLDPALGLDAGTLIELAQHQYRVVAAEGDLVTIEPGLKNAGGVAQGTVATRVAKFDPFGGTAHNWQEHALYLGDKDVLNIEAAATIEVIGASALRDATWEFFGKKPGDAEPAWHGMTQPDVQPTGSTLLEKPAGSIEVTKIGDAEPNRWIRARLPTVSADEPLLSVDFLKLVINRDNDKQPCPASGVTADPGAQAEGFANSTPLAFTSVFYPLGREPRQFDTFYLGCADAFSKKGANVAICFEMADASADSFGVLGAGTHANEFLASVGQDSALRLFRLNTATGALSKHRNLDPLQPPKPGANGQDAEGAPVALVRKPAWRPAIWENPNDTDLVYFATAAGSNVWVWKEDLADANQCGWFNFGPVASDGNAGAQVTGLLYVRQPAPMLYASLDGALYSHSALEGHASQAWAKVPLKDFTGNNDLAGTLLRIGPVQHDLPAPPGGWEVSGIVGVIQDGVREIAHSISLAGNCLPLDAAAGAEVMAEAIPCGIDIGGTIYYFWKQAATPGVIRAVRADLPVGNAPPVLTSRTSPDATTNGPDEIIGNSLDVYASGVQGTVFAVGSLAGTSLVLTWAPFDGVAPGNFSPHELPAGAGPLGGAPTLSGSHVIVPGTQGDAWISPWNPNAIVTGTVTPQIGIVTDNPALLAVNDFVIRDKGAGNAPESATVNQYIGSNAGKFLYALAPASGDPSFATNQANPDLFLFSMGLPATDGTLVDNDEFQLIGANTVAHGEWLALLDGGQIKFAQAFRAPASDIVTLDPDPALADNPTKYWRSQPLTGRIAPFFQLPAPTIRISDLTATPFVFDKPPALNPATQFAKSFQDNGAGMTTLVALNQNWIVAPTGNRNFTFDATISDWKRLFEPKETNAELIWEYWNGSSWAKLELDADQTQHFTGTGLVKFRVPATLAPTDVSGKVNHWIRARLIVGDYGREKITVVTTPITGGGTEQTVNRDTSDFHPPLVVAMRIRYALDTAVFPAAVLTQDSGSWRDQSDANRSTGAYVEGFVPLSVLMQRLSAGVSITPPGETGWGCDCGGNNAASAATSMTADVDADASADTETEATAATSGRAVLLGFDAGLGGERVSVLLLVDERPHDDFAPLIVEALINDHFEAVTIKDTTRALGESGVLSLSFAVKPGARDLFGQARTWLRLRPSRNATNAEWRPIIRGAYLNAAWASATETLTREPLGSSDGRPHLTVRVARPPLLERTLELRVLEPLDEEERQALLDADESPDPDARSVKFGLPELPGDWVLWKQVTDTDDCRPGDRVYSLDESLGEIKFGDGIHGMIPPIGRDSVVAFSYRRTEPAPDGGDGVPANKVTARTALNLVTPVESVEAAFAADQAAGGAPPESTARVMLYGSARLRHRDRAIALRDFEDIALASSPDIAQARAFNRGGTLRMVVVMRGVDPAPGAAQRRELRRLLQSSATPLLGDAAGIVIDRPRVRLLRLSLALRVATLDDAGEAASGARRALLDFFDSASGGVDGAGWPLGTAPAEDDIAYALEPVPGITGLADVDFAEIGADGAVLPWRPTVRPDELVMLAEDGLRFEFLPLEAEA